MPDYTGAIRTTEYLLFLPFEIVSFRILAAVSDFSSHGRKLYECGKAYIYAIKSLVLTEEEGRGEIEI